MASAQAQAYFNSKSAAEQARIRQSWGGADLMDEWFQNAVNAGVPAAVQATGSSRNAEWGGNYADFQNATPSAEWLGKRKPTPAELRRYAADSNQSEDYARFDDRQLADWINRKWNVRGGYFTNDFGDRVEKPTESGANSQAAGYATGEQDAGKAAGGGGGGGGGGRGDGSPYAGVAVSPEVQAQQLASSLGIAAPASVENTAKNVTASAPTFAFDPSKIQMDPGYEFQLNQGLNALQRSAAARGTLLTGGTAKDILDYSQGLASQEYGNAWNRAYNTQLQEYQSKYAPWALGQGIGEQQWQTAQNNALSQWTTGQNIAQQQWQTNANNAFNKWQTQYGGNLSKYLQQQNLTAQLLNPAAPTF